MVIAFPMESKLDKVYIFQLWFRAFKSTTNNCEIIDEGPQTSFHAASATSSIDEGHILSDSMVESAPVQAPANPTKKQNDTRYVSRNYLT